jgi:hypothetical protein
MIPHLPNERKMDTYKQDISVIYIHIKYFSITEIMCFLKQMSIKAIGFALEQLFFCMLSLTRVKHAVYHRTTANPLGEEFYGLN